MSATRQRRAAGSSQVAGESGEQEDQGERCDDGQGDQGHAGGDAEDVAGVVEGVVDPQLPPAESAAEALLSIRSETRE